MRCESDHARNLSHAQDAIADAAREGAEIAVPMGEISLLFLVQSFFIVVAGVLATFTMWRVRHEVSPAFDKARGWAWPLLALGCVAYLCLNIFIALQTG